MTSGHTAGQGEPHVLLISSSCAISCWAWNIGFRVNSSPSIHLETNGKSCLHEFASISYSHFFLLALMDFYLFNCQDLTDTNCSIYLVVLDFNLYMVH